ncbi:MAG TPA: tetratricopeptide repeat protein [Kofleriaceae bacterium]|nr:tetratricopeptide repeat protein [Kofleriaceae bacterium]
MRLVLIALGMCVAVSCGKKQEQEPASAPAGKSVVPADAAAAPPAAPVKAEQPPARPKAYFVALRRGRALDKKKDYPGAIVAFEAALEAVPDDARALSELSWVLFQHGDLARAEEVARASIARATLPELRAASLYNLGRVLEAQKDRDGALAAYRESYALRPHKAVAPRIEQLGGGLNVAPVPAVADASFEPTDEWWFSELDAPRAPFLAARVLENQRERCDVAMKTARGWFVFGDVGYCTGNNRYYRTAATLSVEESGGKTVLVVSLLLGERNYEEVADGEEVWSNHETTSKIYCGLGPSGVPSCTRPLVVETFVDENEDTLEETRTQVRTIELKDGALVITQGGATAISPLAFP